MDQRPTSPLFAKWLGRRCASALLTTAILSSGCTAPPSIHELGVMAQKEAARECEPFQPGKDPQVTPGKKVSGENPKSPLERNSSGFVCVLATVDPEGQLIDPVVVKTSNARFAESFVAALRRWRFTPATKNGVPVSVRSLFQASYAVD
jgi:TonB family protein